MQNKQQMLRTYQASLNLIFKNGEKHQLDLIPQIMHATHARSTLIKYIYIYDCIQRPHTSLSNRSSIVFSHFHRKNPSHAIKTPL